MKHFLYVALLFFAILPVEATVVTGKVTDSKSGLALENVTIFIEGTTIGTTTRKDGLYSLNVVNLGSPKLVASCLGYELKVIPISNNEPIRTLNIVLQRKEYALSEVKVEVKDPNRAENLQLFKTGLFGDSEVGKKCTILNPGVLYFNRSFPTPKKLTLSAFADSAIVIENETLGYQVRYTLMGYKRTPTSIAFLGYQYFIDLYANKKIPSKVLKARQKAYRGSSMHFFRSLYNKSLEQEGFQTYYVDVVKNNDSTMYKGNILLNTTFTRKNGYILRQTESPIDLYQHLSNSDKGTILEVDVPFEIRYVLDKEESNYLLNDSYYGTLIHQKNMQTTLVRLIDNVLMFFPDGSTNDPTQFTTIGYWSYRKLGEFLPLDFKPEE